MNCDLFELFSKRHSFYEITDKPPLDNSQIEEIVSAALSLYPSPFNSQSARVVLLLNDKHHEFWKIVENKLYETAPEDKKEAIKNKINSFASGFGTILFYMDRYVIDEQEEKMPLYALNFKNWGYQSNAILQFMIWSALSAKNIGASLQHYNPLIDEVIQQIFDIPEGWELVAQMPFGRIVSTPAAHEANDIESKIIIWQ